MKKYPTITALLFLGILLLAGIQLKAQTVLSIPKFNILNDANLVFETEQLNAYDYRFKLIDKSKKENSEIVFVLMPLEKDAFLYSFKDAVRRLLVESGVSDSTLKRAAKPDILDIEATKAYVFVQSASITASSLSSAPLAGTICLAKQIEVRQYIRINTADLATEKEKIWMLKVHRNQPISQGKVLSAGLQKKILSDSSRISNFLTEDNAEDDKKIDNGQIVLDKRLFVLATNPSATNSNRVFETYSRKKDAKNRRDYLAAKSLSEIIADKIKNTKLSLLADSTRRVNLMAEDQGQKQLQDSIALYKREEKRMQGLLAAQMDAREKHLDTISLLAEFLGFSFERSALKISRDTKYYQRNEFEQPMTIDGILNRSNGLIPQSDQLIFSQEKLVLVLTRIYENIQSGKKAFDQISSADRKIFQYLLAQGQTPEAIAQLDKEVNSWNYFQAKNKLSMEEVWLEKLKQNKSSSLKLVFQLTKLKQAIDLNDAQGKSLSDLQSEIKKLQEKLHPKDTLEKLRGDIDWLGAQIEKQRKRIETYAAEQPIATFTVEYATFEFNQGFIENVIVFGTILHNKEKVKFTNVQPIGFSRKRDYDDLRNFELWTEPGTNGNNAQYSMNLGEFVVNYLQNLELNRRDYSPADGSQRFDLSKENCKDLYKEPAYQLIEAKVFSDFVGMDPNSPNGLLQTEVGKQINLVTSRAGISFRVKGGVRGNGGKNIYRSRVYWNVGSFTYLHPIVTLSKLENKNRSLVLSSRDQLINGSYVQRRYASTIDLRNYEFLSVGTDLNLILIDLPYFKSTFTLDGGFRFGRTQVIDSIRNYENGTAVNTGKGAEFGMNSLRVYPKLSWEIKPEERYGISLSYTWNQSYLLNPSVLQIASPEAFLEKGKNRLPHSFGAFEIIGHFNPSTQNPTGKLFFRYTFNHQGIALSTNFHQAQLGYSFFLMGRNSSRDQTGH